MKRLAFNYILSNNLYIVYNKSITIGGKAEVTIVNDFISLINEEFRKIKGMSTSNKRFVNNGRLIILRECNFDKWEALLKHMLETVGETQVFSLANRQDADLSSNSKQDVEYSATAKMLVISRTNFSMFFVSFPFFEVSTGVML